MICAQCGQEIDDGALVCYRCGAPTAPRTHEPAPVDERPDVASQWSPIGLAIILAGTALFFAGLAYTGRPVAPMVWVMLALAGGLLAWRLRLR